jgi:hypothetical protein
VILAIVDGMYRTAIHIFTRKNQDRNIVPYINGVANDSIADDSYIRLDTNDLASRTSHGGLLNTSR